MRKTKLFIIYKRLKGHIFSNKQLYLSQLHKTIQQFKQETTITVITSNKYQNINN